MSKNNWQPVIGLEVHIELKTKSKMFCSCKNKHFGEKPNANVCPVCLGLPGALPVPNEKAIKETILIVLAFNCQVNKNFCFDRKNYFYPDLPKGFQISQHFSPIGIKGKAPILIEGKEKEIGISDIHLEEDTANLIHDNDQTLVNFNRSGVPLVEIVSLPEITSAQEAKVYLRRLQQTIRWLGLSDCDMEKGSMRLEANISVTKDRSQLPDYKIEIKNLNSFRFVEKAINYEIKRQIKILESGKTPKQETRGFNAKEGKTYSQRSKEVAKDYRYFPEPDIPPFNFSQKEINSLKTKLKILPWKAEQKIINSKIPWQWAQILCQVKEKYDLFWEVAKMGKDKNISLEQVAKWMINRSCKGKAGDIIEAIVREQSKFDLSKEEIRKIVKQIVGDNPRAIADFKKGKTQVVGFLIGQVQQKTQGRADPKITARIIQEEIRK